MNTVPGSLLLVSANGALMATSIRNSIIVTYCSLCQSTLRLCCYYNNNNMKMSHIINQQDLTLYMYSHSVATVIQNLVEDILGGNYAPAFALYY